MEKEIKSILERWFPDHENKDRDVLNATTEILSLPIFKQLEAVRGYCEKEEKNNNYNFVGINKAKRHILSLLNEEEGNKSSGGEMKKEIKTITIKLEDFNNLMLATTNAKMLLDYVTVNSEGDHIYKNKSRASMYVNEFKRSVINASENAGRIVTGRSTIKVEQKDFDNWEGDFKKQKI